MTPGITDATLWHLQQVALICGPDAEIQEFREQLRQIKEDCE